MNPTRARLLYTPVAGETVERCIVPYRVVWHKHADLPHYEWFIEAFDIDARSQCLLRLSGCDFTQADLPDPRLAR